jgi:hypothetical protein
MERASRVLFRDTTRYSVRLTTQTIKTSDKEADNPVEIWTGFF